MISPKDLIDKYGVEGLCETADNYYQNVTDTNSLKGKPFTNARDTPGIMIRLGYLLSGLQLTKGLTVLDFGAGTCWLSKIISQMGCKSISLDPSQTALEIGKEMFKEAPVFGELFAEPEFLKFDGKKIPLPDSSIDRIISFDAFHHVPNPEEVMTEFARVLKDGGIIGFSEPVGDHSVTPDSQHEMEAYDVLENDINLDAMLEHAESIGFTDVAFKVHPSQEFWVTKGERDLMHADRPKRWSKRFRRINTEVHFVLNNEAIFLLQKGNLVIDSRFYQSLAAKLTVDSSDLSFSSPADQELKINVTAKNTGKGPWIFENQQDLGVVKLGVHLFDAENDMIDFDYYRLPITSIVEAGDSYQFEASIPMPKPGEYLIEFDLVAEGVSWFQRCGMETTTAKLTVP